jgi:hypothetical protein
MAIKPTNNYFTDFEDNGLFSGEGSVVADIFADIVPELAPMTTAAVAASSQPTTVQPTSVATPAATTTSSNPTLNDLIQAYQQQGATTTTSYETEQGTQYNTTPNELANGWMAWEKPAPVIGSEGQGMDATPIYGKAELGGFSRKDGDFVNFYDLSGNLVDRQKWNENDLKSAWNDLGPLAMAAVTMGGGAGLLGNSLFGLTGNAAAAAGGALAGGVNAGLTDQNILQGALLGAAGGAKSLELGTIGDTAIKLGDVSKAVSFAQNPSLLTASSLLSSLNENKANIGALEGLTNSGRTGDDMGGSYEPTETPVASMPNGIQLAGPMTLSVGGVPIYAESSGASAVRPPAGYEVMSSKLADAKPAGSYYDPTINAWLTPNNAFSNVSNADQLLSDAELFNANVNTLDANTIRGLISDSISQIPQGLTLEDITGVIGNQNFATPQDIQSAINSINIPQGLTEQNVQTIVSNALANNPSLTTDQVSQIVNNAVANIPKGLTASDVTGLLSQQNFATPKDIQTAINNIKIPQGLTSTDVQSIVSNALANNPSLKASDVQSIVSNAVSKLPAAPTAQDIIDIIGSQGLASASQLNQQGQELMTVLQKQGVDYNTALNQALKAQSSTFNTAIGATQSNIDALAQTLGKTKESLLAELNMTEADLQKQLASVQTGLESKITGTQNSVDALAQTLGKTKESLLSELNTTEADLQKQIAGVQTGLGSQISNLSQQTQQQLAQQSAQTQQQFNSLTAAQQAQANALVNQGTSLTNAINQVQSGLGQQISNLSQQTQSQLAQQSAQTQQQFNSLTAAQKAQADALVSQGASFNTALNQALSSQAGLFTGQLADVKTGLESQLNTQGQQLLNQLQQQGVNYQTALDQAIAQQNAQIGQTQSSVDVLARDLGVTKEQLLSQLNTTEQALQSQLGGVQSSLEQQLAAQNEQLMASMQAQEDEYQKALQDAFAEQNTLTNEQLSKVLNSAIGLFGTLGAQNAANRASNRVNYSPAMFGTMQPMPEYTPEYFNLIQQNYNQLLPTVPQDVATPLANWYNTQYGA